MPLFLPPVGPNPNISFGSVFGGHVISTYLVTKLQQKGEVEKERISRQAQLLQEIAGQVENVNHAYLKYWALTTEAIRYRKSGRTWSDDKKKERGETKNELFNAFKELTNAEAKLMLMGETKAFQLLRTYGENVAQFRKTVVVNENPLPDEEIEQWKESIFEHRKNLFDELAIIFKKL